MTDTVCPYCGKKNDLHGEVKRNGIREPQPLPEGAVCICIGCGNVALFESGAMRKPSDAEHAELLRVPQISRALVALAIAKAKDARKQKHH